MRDLSLNSLQSESFYWTTRFSKNSKEKWKAWNLRTGKVSGVYPCQKGAHKEEEIQIKEATHVIIWEGSITQLRTRSLEEERREHKFQIPVLPLTALCGFGQVAYSLYASNASSVKWKFSWHLLHGVLAMITCAIFLAQWLSHVNGSIKLTWHFSEQREGWQEGKVCPCPVQCCSGPWIVLKLMAAFPRRKRWLWSA